MKTDTIWTCECGLHGTANEIGGRADIRWGGLVFQHHHGYPIGHVAMTAASPGDKCLWQDDLDGNWDTACGACYCFDYDFRNEGRGSYRFCPKCGRGIEVASIPKEETEP